MKENNEKAKVFYLKLIVIGIVVFIGLYWFNSFVLAPFVASIDNWDKSVGTSYLVPIISSVIGLATLCIICFIIVMRKINELMKKIDNLQDGHH